MAAERFDMRMPLARQDGSPSDLFAGFLQRLCDRLAALEGHTGSRTIQDLATQREMEAAQERAAQAEAETICAREQGRMDREFLDRIRKAVEALGWNPTEGAIPDWIQAEVRTLRDWKASALRELGDVRPQEVAKALNLTLGTPIHSAILPGIQALQAQVRDLMEQTASDSHKMAQVRDLVGAADWAGTIEKVTALLKAEADLRKRVDAIDAYILGEGPEDVRLPSALTRADVAFIQAMARGILTARAKYPGNRGRFVALAAESGEAFHAMQRLETGRGTVEELGAELRQMAQMACRMAVEGDSTFPPEIQAQFPVIVEPDPTMKPHHPGAQGQGC